MASLSSVLQDQIKVLHRLAPLHARLSNTSIPTTTLEHWRKRLRLVRILEGTSSLFEIRAAAWDRIVGLCNPREPYNSQSNFVRFGEADVPFEIARHLAISAYVCTSWATYDRLANYCGRVAGSPALSEDPSRNPKVLGSIIDNNGKDSFGFACHSLLQESYAWPVRVAYKIRNWIVHEGVEEGDVRMFAGDHPNDGLRLHLDAQQYLLKYGQGQIVAGKFEKCRIEATDEKWITLDLLEILPKYHEEIDTMFCALVSWATQALESQIRFFAERDV